jgi:hypothetical protein
MKKMYIFEVIFMSLIHFIGAEIGLCIFSGIAIVGFIEGKTLIGIIVTVCSIILLKILSKDISENILDGINNLKSWRD